MAMARIVHDSDDVEMVFEVHADESFPDVVSEVTAACKRLYDEVMVENS